MIQLARDGDRGAFAEIVDLYKDRIYQLGYRMLGNAQEAEDVTQETFIRVYLNLTKYDLGRKFSTWIYRIGTNLCIDRLRQRKHTLSLDAETGGAHGDGDSGTDGYAMLASKEATPEDQAMMSETKDQLKKAIDQLPEKYRSVIVLRYFHDLTLQEIGDVLNMPVTTIKTRVHRGRDYLRRKIEQQQLL